MKVPFKLCFIVFHFGIVYALDFNYHKHGALTQFLSEYPPRYPQLYPKLYSIGKTIRGRKLWVVEVSAANRTQVAIPNVKLIGNIHGNEAVGREVLLHFLEYLGDNYGKNPDIKWLLQNTRIHVLPSMNPDGFEISSPGICVGEHGRSNSRNMDLNRNFPDYYMKNLMPTQPESKAIQNWMKEVPFILSASLHGGALVANYPFDTVKEMKWEELLRQLTETSDSEEQQTLRDDYIASLPINPPSISADDDVFIHLATVYSNRHPTMHLGLACPDSDKNFTGGITNGAAWYPFRGGMQDFNYAMHGCMELTLEISCCKYPQARELSYLWKANRDALLDLIKQAHRGVRGVLLNGETSEPVPFATLKIGGREMNFTSSKQGEFWRILLPGVYQLQIDAEGYHRETVGFRVPDYKKQQPKLVTLKISLYTSKNPKPTSSTSQRPTSSTPGALIESRFSGPESEKTEARQTNDSDKSGKPNIDGAPVKLESTASKVFPSYSAVTSSSTTFFFDASVFLSLFSILAFI